MQLLDVLTDIRKEIDKCYFVLCFELESGLPLGISTIEYKDDANSIGAAFGQMLDIVIDAQTNARNETVRQVLNGFSELVIETTRSVFFILVPDRTNTIAIAVGVPNVIKIGYARVAIQKHYMKLVQGINEMT
jgi:hypothetical protein